MIEPRNNRPTWLVESDRILPQISLFMLTEVVPISTLLLHAPVISSFEGHLRDMKQWRGTSVPLAMSKRPSFTDADTSAREDRKHRVYWREGGIKIATRSCERRELWRGRKVKLLGEREIKESNEKLKHISGWIPGYFAIEADVSPPSQPEYETCKAYEILPHISFFHVNLSISWFFVTVVCSYNWLWKTPLSARFKTS